MASKTEVAIEIEHYLGWIPRAVAALPSVERNWRAVEGAGVLSSAEIRADQSGFRDEWSDVVAHLGRLHALYRADEMTEPQRRQYAALLSLVRDMLPVMEKLRLERPPQVLLEPSTEDRDGGRPPSYVEP